ncbi:hypothetical protein C488_02376 [Natrinema pellirubrum DSM 15624]|uniref:Uncharacterized protein n=1 Tax=Natrinema pellirubrum (strain DSM 15624 / CIP 106293 / JCM 10476 / NCIMB 786 / 157) TaxID=797303 RepID=L0JHJ8_NATP1|nr:hypothetical protein [Natrinema pellirubrum]AGB31020.1 hypothetical protein Natpe_1108 [Natrinema pellirubrum DSM 15624]ELY81135.1 hypothetical protein C488_02376 [Natrinema pellirubrum DSM 15624]
MPRQNATGDEAGGPTETDDGTRLPVETEPTATIAATRTPSDAGAVGHPNTLTIIGQGTPSSFEITVDGGLELAAETGTANVTVRSGTSVEGTVESETVTVRFSGDLTDVTFVDRGITGREPATTPNVHVDYGVPDERRS